MITTILYLFGYSFTTFITVSELLIRSIHRAALLHGCLQITTSHQSTAYRSTTVNPQQPNTIKPVYVASEDNKADSISHGKFGLSADILPCLFSLPAEISPFLNHVSLYHDAQYHANNVLLGISSPNRISTLQLPIAKHPHSSSNPTLCITPSAL